MLFFAFPHSSQLLLVTKKLQCGIDLVQVCQMPRQIQEPFRIAERGFENAPDGVDAALSIPFDHRPCGHHEVTHSRLDFLFETPQRGDRFVPASRLR
jgi:hypothetical protein